MISEAGDLGTITRQPYERLDSLDGYKYVINCDTVDVINRFMQTECSRNMSRTDVYFAKDFLAYQDGLLDRGDVAALDYMLTQMVVAGKDCITLQGEISGC